jgi:hypothetical protein
MGKRTFSGLAALLTVVAGNPQRARTALAALRRINDFVMFQRFADHDRLPN